MKKFIGMNDIAYIKDMSEIATEILPDGTTHETYNIAFVTYDNTHFRGSLRIVHHLNDTRQFELFSLAEET